MGSKFPTLLDLAAPDLDAWAILGDNFYDRDGSITSAFFQTLGPAIKRRFFFSVVGNHDYWVGGTQHQQGPADQFANGFMQYFPHDSMASIAPVPSGLADNFFDFSGDPSVIQPDGNFTLPKESNFFWYHQLGNVGLIGFSGAGDFERSKPWLREACASFDQDVLATSGIRPQTIYLIGHWTKSGASGCSAHMGTPDAYAYVIQLPGCDHGNVKFMMGHEHCNKKWDKPILGAGYLIGGSGAGWGPSGPEPDNKCPSIGFVYLDTTGGREKLTLFTVWNNGTDHFPALRDCFKERGIASCTHLGEVWTNVSLPVFKETLV